MTRLEFRAEVPDARPPSAWALVALAGATLWITQQLRPWAIALQVAAILLSLATRRSPRAWQTSPITLNLGMFGIVGATISLALEGNPATVSLAHFAALTSGLQLMDTRPRRSEFLLVALALFQVILASNLTDSLLFPPLLVLFLVATTWTLIVHTLRTEAIEAGDGGAAQKAITIGLVRMTLVASVASVMVALVLFVMMPRMRSSVIKGGIANSMALAGFSDRVELGTIGRIRQDRTVVLRIETHEGELPERSQSYWRGLAFDAFDGREWSISRVASFRPRYPVSGTPRFGVDMNGGRDAPSSLVQQIIREPVEAGVVFTAGTARYVEGPVDVLEYDINGGLYAPRQLDERIRYTVRSDAHHPTHETLRRDRTVQPEDRVQSGDRHGRRYLALPELAPQVRELALRITAGAETDADRVRAVEDWLRRNGRYTDTPPDMSEIAEASPASDTLGDTSGSHDAVAPGTAAAPGNGDRPLSPVEGFLLGELAGHCEYFASGMVVLLRSIDIHSRLVNGFAGGRVNDWGGFVELARSDAHAWVEVHYADADWVRYDPTPPDLRLRSAFAGSIGERFTELYSALETWWFQRVVDFDSSDQIQALKAAWGAWRSIRSPSERSEETKPGESLGFDWHPRDLPWGVIAPVGLALVLLFELYRRRRAESAEAALPVAYARALQLLARRGFTREPTTTAREFAADVGDALPDEAGRAFDELTEGYLAERFGGRSDPDAASRLATLRQGIRPSPR